MLRWASGMMASIPGPVAGRPRSGKDMTVSRIDFSLALALRTLVGGIFALQVLVGGTALGYDSGAPDYIKDYGILDKTKFQRLQRFREVVVVDIADLIARGSTITVPSRALVIISNTDRVDHLLTFPAAKDTGMDFDLLSEAIVPGNYWAGEFDTLGSFKVFCTLHPGEAHGTVRVEARP